MNPKNEWVDQVSWKMVQMFAGDYQQIQHFFKVYSYAALIGRKEKLEPDQQLQLELAALVHDIGIKPARPKYHSTAGYLQEKEGPNLARALLEEVEVPSVMVNRICYLVAHHHTYAHVDGLDYRILLEADMLANLEESGTKLQDKAQLQVFCTKAGRERCCFLFGLEYGKVFLEENGV